MVQPLLLILLIVLSMPASGRGDTSSPAKENSPYFAIEVVDADTGRGVPLAELRTTNEVRHYTDSNGLVAFNEPGLMGEKVFFTVTIPGYDFPTDGYGSRGKALEVVAGGSAKLSVRRTNIAERLYRVTGQGIYADSHLLGRPVPTKHPVLNGKVMGQDSVYALPYRGRIYWFWGDTTPAAYPLGNFGMSGATSALPAQGGLPPSRGIDLAYFTKPDGFSRPMSTVPGKGAVWVDGIAIVKDDTGRERMVGSFDRIEKLGVPLGKGLVAFNDETDTLEPIAALPMTSQINPRGHALNVAVEGVDYVYFAYPYPLLRVRATYADAIRPATYEAFTCLKAGSRFDAKNPPLDRDESGKLVYAWKRDTDPVGVPEQDKLIASGALKAEEAWLRMRDAVTGDAVAGHNGTVAWNAFRKRYVMIFNQVGGKASHLGEVYYAEADVPEGPWPTATRVASHPDYSFYNPCHHPFFDEADGKVIYFQGTYTAEFSSAKFRTPRYDYNQIMYRLDLSDPRLAPGGKK